MVNCSICFDFYLELKSKRIKIRENEQLLATLGVDIDRLKRGYEVLDSFPLRIQNKIAHLRDRFHNLTPDLVRYHAHGGMLAALTLFDINEDALYWLRTRQQMALDYMKAIHAQFDRFNRKVELGGIPRTATFSSLTGR